MALPRIPKVTALLKSHFFAGLFVLIPIWAVGWIVAAGVRTIWRFHELLPTALRPEALLPDPKLLLPLNIAFTVGVVLVLAFAISLLGWSSKHFLGRKALDVLSGIIERIPVLSGVYSAIDQLLRTFTASGAKQFSRVVYVEFPRKDAWTLAFVTGHSRDFPGSLNVYVPTTPIPTAGFFIIVPEKETRDSHMNVEEAFKSIISLGIVSPTGGAGGAGGAGERHGRR